MGTTQTFALLNDRPYTKTFCPSEEAWRGVDDSISWKYTRTWTKRDDRNKILVSNRTKTRGFGWADRGVSTR